MSCRDIFNSAISTRKDNRVDIVNIAKPNCICELESVSEHSILGIVLGSEYLGRLLFFGQHIDVDGNVLPAAFNDVCTHGLSVQRSVDNQYKIEWDKIGEDMAAVQTLQKSKETIYRGAVVANCNNIREILHSHGIDKEKHPFAVYDSAEKDFPLHAEIMSSYNKADRTLRSELRDEIAQKFSIFYIR